MARISHWRNAFCWVEGPDVLSSWPTSPQPQSCEEMVLLNIDCKRTTWVGARFPETPIWET
jgi:hypothetical protein